jgi:hypothetical protein
MVENPSNADVKQAVEAAGLAYSPKDYTVFWNDDSQEWDWDENIAPEDEHDSSAPEPADVDSHVSESAGRSGEVAKTRSNDIRDCKGNVECEVKPRLKPKMQRVNEEFETDSLYMSFGGEPARVAIEEPHRVAHYEYKEPLSTYSVGRGYHAVVMCRVGSVTFRVTLDTGCARNFVRSSFMRQLESSKKTCQSVKGRKKGDVELNCVGITASMKTPPVTHWSWVELSLHDVPEDGSKPGSPARVEVGFGELDSAADCLLIGLPTLQQWSTEFSQDADGRPWVEFKKLGVMLPIETPIDS